MVPRLVVAQLTIGCRRGARRWAHTLEDLADVAEACALPRGDPLKLTELAAAIESVQARDSFADPIIDVQAPLGPGGD